MNLVLQWITVFVIPSAALAGYGELRINNGESNTGILEIQVADGIWGTVCSNGFDQNAAKVACRQLGYGYLGHYSEEVTGDPELPIAICYTECSGRENKLDDCIIHHQCNLIDHHFCTRFISITCYGGGDDDSSGSSSSNKGISAAVIIGATIGVLVIVAISCILCLAYLKYYQFRQRTFIAQQRRPRILIARVSRTTTIDSSGPPPPPPYTPTQPTSDYTPVPPRGYQPVPCDHYTTTPGTPSSDVPSEPPPEYTPSDVSVN